jgi:phage gpG-like protein
LKQITIRIKKSQGAPFPEKPLLRTGRLFNAIQAIRINASFQSNTGLGFRIGVTDPEAAKYGRLHDQGLSTRTVQRKFMGVSARDAKALTDLIRREVRKLIRE